MNFRYQQIKESEKQKKIFLSILKKEKKSIGAWNGIQEIFGIKVNPDLMLDFENYHRKDLSIRWVRQTDFLFEAVKNGLRSVFSLGIKKEELPLFIEEVNKNRLSVFYSKKRQPRTPGVKFGQTNVAENGIKVFVAKTKKLANRAFLLDWDKNKVGVNTKERNNNLAILYNYPKCCVKFFNNIQYGFFDRIFRERSFLNTTGKFYWELNNFLFYFPIAHFSCSFNCLDSIALSKKYLDLAQSKFFDSFEFVKSVCAGSILFFTEDVFFLIKGRIANKKNNRIFYNSILCSYDFYPWLNNFVDLFFIAKMQMIFKRGDNLSFNKFQMEILKGEKVIATVKKTNPSAFMFFPFK
ncbi:MAG: hypothetical protein COU85_00055 [Candidatus Portnoybacteria bacterium CG10_big_fil_rev_8_21_14_0_10_44_7]|uniref:Uncharacterized protein n=1 Tax=Candidatus Portnoybacteria bacterium CG10_big_fil_rev_8_21_14_0_10_44_7 TaxID=1974816 RepID=A0A2M8KJL4_9BACT|nr:MAG: hypothetical protein COU85_00055 [Candidatus Portnoybacteria bacterium CG10_big_fil_rev_8_21_14_0_10_44_7]